MTNTVNYYNNQVLNKNLNHLNQLLSSQLKLLKVVIFQKKQWKMLWILKKIKKKQQILRIFLIFKTSKKIKKRINKRKCYYIKCQIN